MVSRFAELTDTQLMELLDDKLSEHSKNTTKYAVDVLSNYASTRNGTLHELEEMPSASFDTHLSSFYAEL